MIRTFWIIYTQGIKQNCAKLGITLWSPGMSCPPQGNEPQWTRLGKYIHEELCEGHVVAIRVDDALYWRMGPPLGRQGVNTGEQKRKWNTVLRPKREKQPSPLGLMTLFDLNLEFILRHSHWWIGAALTTRSEAESWSTREFVILLSLHDSCLLVFACNSLLIKKLEKSLF